jgi:hypothetical protein
MDAPEIATIASTIVALLGPYLKKAGEKIGEKAGEAAWNATKKLYDAVKARFSAKPEAEKVIKALEQSPEDKDVQAAVRFYLKEMLTTDESLKRELALLLEEALEAGAQTIFRTTISGNVQGFVQAQNIYGSVSVNAGSDFLHQIWDKLDADLQDALAMAYNQARRDGTNKIRTRYFFAALARLQPKPLQEFLIRIPRNALPNPLDEQVTTEPLLLREHVDLSGCIEDSLRHLAPKATQSRKITAADMFVDIARYGSGASVERFRSHGITPEKVSKIVQELGWDIIER